MIDYVTGLVPLFRREPVRMRRAVRPAAPQPVREEAPAAEPGAPAEDFLVPEEPFAVAEAPAPAPKTGPHDLSNRRFTRGAPPELRAARVKLADAAGMAEVCRLSCCRRARRCMGVGGVACLAEHRERALPVLMAVKARAEAMGEEEEEMED